MQDVDATIMMVVNRMNGWKVVYGILIVIFLLPIVVTLGLAIWCFWIVLGSLHLLDVHPLMSVFLGMYVILGLMMLLFAILWGKVFFEVFKPDKEDEPEQKGENIKKEVVD